VGDVIHSMVGESGFKDNTKQRVCIGWRYPPIDWVKINVDGCSKGNPGVAGAGGVSRDAISRWIVGFALNIRICTSVGAELWAITNGLKLAWSKGFRKIILESNSSLAVDLITKDKIIFDKNYNLIMQARELLAKEWDIRVLHVYKEANSVADWLANYGLTMSFLDRSSISFNDPHADLYCILYYDMIRSTLPHLI